jgi:hypothetical protein
MGLVEVGGAIIAGAINSAAHGLMGARFHKWSRVCFTRLKAI